MSLAVATTKTGRLFSCIHESSVAKTRCEVPPSPAPPSVTVSNDESDFYTIADVAANDRLGLLHDLTRVIADHGLEIYISKAAPVLDQVTDTFYLKDAQGRKIMDPAVLESLERGLLAAARVAAEGDGG